MMRCARSAPATENKAVDAAIEQATFEIPQRSIDAGDRRAGRRAAPRRRRPAPDARTLPPLTGQSEEAWRSELREQATRQLKARLVLDEVAEKEGFTTPPEEVQAEIETTALGYGDQAEQVRRTLSTEENRRRIATSLRRQKAIQRLVEGTPAATPQDTAGIDGHEGRNGEEAIAHTGTTEAAAPAASAGQPAKRGHGSHSWRPSRQRPLQLGERLWRVW